MAQQISTQKITQEYLDEAYRAWRRINKMYKNSGVACDQIRKYFPLVPEKMLHIWVHNYHYPEVEMTMVNRYPQMLKTGNARIYMHIHYSGKLPDTSDPKYAVVVQD